MGSSEISSSEINQGSSNSFDLGKQLPDSTSLPTTISSADAVVGLEESVWKKYSSHYEFPLSILIAVGIHVIAVLCVVAYMTVSFYWGSPRNSETETVVIAEPRVHQEGQEQQEKPGGSNGNDGVEGKDQFKTELDSTLMKTPDTGRSLVKELSDDLLAKPLPDTKPAPSDKQPGLGRLDGGIGNKRGPGIGNEEGSGVPMGRNKRWRIQFNYDEPEVLFSQFANLQTIVASRLNNGRYMVFSKLTNSAPFQYQEMTTDAFIGYANEKKQLWFINTDRVTCENFGLAVNMAERPLTLVVLVPEAMEQAILAAELKHHNMTEDQVRQNRLVTTFRVVREGGRYQVVVAKSQVLKPVESH